MEYRNRVRTWLEIFFVAIVVLCLLTTCNAQDVPNSISPVETSTQSAITPTILPIETLQPAVAASTATVSTLSMNAQALKNIIFTPCISVEQPFPSEMVIPWNLLVAQGKSLFILNPMDNTSLEIPVFSESYSVYSDRFSVSPNGKWLAYQNTYPSKLFVEPTDTLLTNTDADRIVVEKSHTFFLSRWVDNNTVLVVSPPSEENGYYSTVFLDPFTGEEHEFLLQEMPNFLAHHFGGAVIPTHYLRGGELVPDPTMKKLIYPERGDDGEIYTPCGI